MEQEPENEPRVDTWADYAGEYLKADIVKQFPLQVVVKGIEAINLDGKPLLAVVVEYDGKDWKINLNKTNQAFLRNTLESPKAIIGKVLTFEKTKVRNPSTNTLVDSLIITAVE